MSFQVYEWINYWIRSNWGLSSQHWIMIYTNEKFNWKWQKVDAQIKKLENWLRDTQKYHNLPMCIPTHYTILLCFSPEALIVLDMVFLLPLLFICHFGTRWGFFLNFSIQRLTKLNIKKPKREERQRQSTILPLATTFERGLTVKLDGFLNGFILPILMNRKLSNFQVDR